MPSSKRAVLARAPRTPLRARLAARMPPRGVVRAALRLRRDGYQPRFPVVDAHGHLGSSLAGRWRRRSADHVVRALDAAGVTSIVNLDGGFGSHLARELDRFAAAGERVVTFCSMDFATIAADPRFGETEARRLRDSVARGARGLKVWKQLGLELRDADGRLVPVDDERLAPVWDAAAELAMPVLIHVADPRPFFEPLDDTNERLQELRRHPEWHYWPVRTGPAAPGFPSREELVDQLERLLARHRDTAFIGAHLAACGDELDRLTRMLREHPNLSVDIAARINELGRQPDRARRFLHEFEERVLFGTDAGPDPRWYPVYFRFLETGERSLPFSIYDPPLQGDWRIDGLSLPDSVLRRLYADNARRLIGFGS